MDEIVCEVYRCAQKEGMYVYIAKRDGLEKIPESLRKRTGRLELAMTLVLTSDKKLARTRAEDVITAINDQGFYIQMPPSPGTEMDVMNQAIAKANDFLER